MSEIPIRVMNICLAYESGYGKGLDRRNCKNPYPMNDSWWAWDYGYAEGYRKCVDSEEVKTND